MIPARRPANEVLRLRTLHELNLLDTPPDSRLDRITAFASECLQVPIAAISLVDARRQWFKSRIGLPTSETPRDLSFCAHAVFSRNPLIVEDALLDRRFCENPLVLGDVGIRSYAGMPLLTGEVALGALCIIDRVARHFDPVELAVLATLRDIVLDEILLGPRGPADEHERSTQR